MRDKDMIFVPLVDTWGNMLIEKNNKNIVISLSSGVDSFALQRLLNYVKYLESTASSSAKQSDIDKLADDVNETWWLRNGKKFLK